MNDGNGSLVLSPGGAKGITGMGTLAGERRVPTSPAAPAPPKASPFGSLALTQNRPKTGTLDEFGHAMLSAKGAAPPAILDQPDQVEE